MLSLVLRELIDTQWNVNQDLFDALDAEFHELIDTQWNVNVYSSIYYRYCKYELIDTQWNVNVAVTCSSSEHSAN